jgi:hypothetical protein
MAIAFDAANSASGSSISSLTYALTVGAAGANRFLFVGVSNDSGTLATVSTVTYAAAGLTQKWSFTFSSAGLNYRNSGYFMVAPATGGNNVVVTLSDADAELSSGAMAFTGVDQTTPLATQATATGTASPATVDVSSATDDVVVDNVCTGFSSMVVGANQTSRWEQESIGRGTAGSGSTEAGAGTVTMSWTLTAGFDNGWTIGAVPIKMSGAAGIVGRLGSSKLLRGGILAGRLK